MKRQFYSLFLVWALFAHFSFAATPTCASIESPVSFEKIQSLLQRCQITRIDQLLPLLPAEFRSRFVLVHSSRSLQGATAAFPRVILFGLDARFILSFSGDPQLKGYDSLETIEFDDLTRKFHFRSISEISNNKSQRALELQVMPGNPVPLQLCWYVPPVLTSQLPAVLGWVPPSRRYHPPFSMVMVDPDWKLRSPPEAITAVP